MKSSPEDIFYEKLAVVAEDVPETSTELPPDLEEASGVTKRNLFTNPDTHPVVLDLAMIKTFNLDWLGWLTDTLMSEISRVFNTTISDVNRNKILAVKALHVTDVFWNEWEVFDKILMSLNGLPPRWDVIDIVETPQLMAGVGMANKIRKEHFSDEVARFAAACLLHDDVHYAPPPLEFCQIFVAQPKYKCLDCKNEGTMGSYFDGLCDDCVRRFDHDKPFSFKPDPDAVKEGRGSNLEYFFVNDPDPVKARLEELRRIPHDQLDIKETSEDIQAAKLLIAEDFTKIKNEQLATQLDALNSWLGE